MNRLTNKFLYDGEELYGSPYGIKCDNLKHLEKVYDKLGALEDIEEELGCPLEVLKPNQKVEFIKGDETLCADIMGVNIQTKKIMIGSAWNFKELPLNQFNRSWWLKEDKNE